MVIEAHKLFAAEALGLAQHLAQGPAGLHVLGDEADLVLAALNAVEELRFHGVEGLLELLFRDGPDVLLEAPVREAERFTKP